MTIFNTKPKCEICGHREPQKRPNGDYKKRCDHCADRYDSQGVAFIIYCEFWRFEPIKRKEHGIVKPDVTFRVCDDEVQIIPKGWDWISGSALSLEAEMENFRNYRLVHIEPAIMP